MAKKWYSVRCLFRHSGKENIKKRNLYEERITIWEADSFEEAIVLAEEEAKEYAQGLGCKFVGFSQSYRIYKDKIYSGAEIFSLMRESDKESKDYVSSYFDTGKERAKKLENKIK